MGMHLMATIEFGGIVSMIVIILKVAIGLGAVIFVHELGHFLVAKACGVKVEKFMIGFDIGGYKIELAARRNRVRHRHPAAGRLRENARPG